MISLIEYILESKSKDEKKSRRAISKASKKIIQLLKKQDNLSNYVDTLNKILKGDTPANSENTDLYLKALTNIFSGTDEEVNLVYKKYKCIGEMGIKVGELFPTQSEIDIENSAKWATKDWGARGVANMFKDEPFGKSFPVPVLVYNDGKKNWIIDGHHRWSQVALINPEASLYCMVIKGKEDVREFLKLVQSVIAGVNANRNNVKELPVGKAKPENNIFGKQLRGENLTKRIAEMLHANKNVAKILFDILKKHEESCRSIEDIPNIVYKNREIMYRRKQEPESWAAPRPVMPQSDKAGKTGDSDSGVNNNGSALNKLKNVNALPAV